LECERGQLAAMSLPLTLGLIVAVLALALFAGWRGAKPSQPHLGVRMIPWRFIMILSAAIVVMLLVHLATLLGVPQRHR
jgi:hypothetical protein